MLAVTSAFIVSNVVIMRWGVLGASQFALHHMAPAIHAAQGFQLVGLATSNRGKCHYFWVLHRICKYFDYDAHLEDPVIDVIYIPLPNHLHV